VGVSNDAVNFLNSAVGSKAATFRTILIVAALGIIIGCTFSSGMMEVARKGIFHPEHFYFSEIIILFLAVMVTDVILLDAFNTFGMPTSTTVSIVFELLGAAVGISIIKIYTDPNALEMGAYINSGKALAIIAGILLSVIVAFSVGVIIQYLTRLLFSFDYESKMKYFGALWGGLAIAAITYFMLVKGAKGSSFMTDDIKSYFDENAFLIIMMSFVFWTIILQLILLFTKIDIIKVIVMVGTFALAMAFAGNDLVNFIGVPLAGYNSYQIFMDAGATGADTFLMGDLAGKVPTPTLLLLLAGIIMSITLWTSKKAKRVIQTSLDLGRQYEGAERFSSYAVSRTLVRRFSQMAIAINNYLPKRMNSFVDSRFDERPFTVKQTHLGKDAPAFDMIRAAVTLVVASVLIALGTSLKLPLSTTYVTFMVFMGTSLADGAWGRESAVYRVSGVLSVIGGWFFTAFSAFSVSFIMINIFYWGGPIAVIAVLLIAGYIIYRSHKYHNKRLEEQIEFEKFIEEGTLTKGRVIEMSVKNMATVLGELNKIVEDSIKGLEKEDLALLSDTYKRFTTLETKIHNLKVHANKTLDNIEEDEIEAGHLYLLVVDYLNEMAYNVQHIIKPSLSHVDNNHKPLISVQIEELKSVQSKVKEFMISTINLFKSQDVEEGEKIIKESKHVIKSIRNVRKKQIKRIKDHEIGTRNSMLYLNHLGEQRNLVLFTNRLITVFNDLILNPEEDEEDVDNIEVNDSGKANQE
jgi:hypothetical protein